MPFSIAALQAAQTIPATFNSALLLSGMIRSSLSSEMLDRKTIKKHLLEEMILMEDLLSIN